MIDAPPGFVWKYPDEGTLECTDCGMLVRDVVVDLHTCP